MKKGGLDGGFWVVFTRQGPLTPEGYANARAHALRTAAAIKKMASDNSWDFARAQWSSDAAPIKASGKRIVFLSIENAYPLGRDARGRIRRHGGILRPGRAHDRARAHDE